MTFAEMYFRTHPEYENNAVNIFDNRAKLLIHFAEVLTYLLVLCCISSD